MPRFKYHPKTNKYWTLEKYVWIIQTFFTKTINSIIGLNIIFESGNEKKFFF